MEFDVDFYKSKNGKEYAKEFLDGIKVSHNELWEQTIGIIKKIKHREYHREPFSKSLKNGLFEIKGHYKKLEARVNYAFKKDRRIFLLNGYIKQDEKSEKLGISFGRKLLLEMEGKDE